MGKVWAKQYGQGLTPTLFIRGGISHEGQEGRSGKADLELGWLDAVLRDEGDRMKVKKVETVKASGWIWGGGG